MKTEQAAIIIRIAAVFLFFLAWQLIADFKIINADFLAGPIQAVLSLLRPSVQSQIAVNSSTTLYEIAVAYVVAVSLGLGIGLAIGISKYFTSVFEPLVLALFAVPKISLLPMFILWFGIGIPSKVVFGIFAGMFPVMVNTIAGAKQVNQAHIQLARSMGANSTQLYSKVILPSIIPTAFAGMRLSLILVSVTVTLAEMYQGTVTGLGSLIFYWSTIFLSGPLYGVILVFSLVLIATNQLLLMFEKRLSRLSG